MMPVRASVSPIMIATAAQETALYARELVHSFRRCLRFTSIVMKISTTGITSSEGDLRARLIREFFKRLNAPMYVRNINKFCDLLSPWKVTKAPMPLWQWVNWPPSKTTAGIGFDIYGIELRK